MPRRLTVTLPVFKPNPSPPAVPASQLPSQRDELLGRGRKKKQRRSGPGCRKPLPIRLRAGPDLAQERAAQGLLRGGSAVRAREEHRELTRRQRGCVAASLATGALVPRAACASGARERRRDRE